MTPELYEQQYAEFKRRSVIDGRFRIEDGDKRSHIKDDTPGTPYDDHYLYHTAWAARRIYANRPSQHVDIASFTYFSAIISAFVPVTFLDYRPIGVLLDNFKSGRVDITHMDVPDSSIESLSCMHVMEHIGLGRYGDPVDPLGDLVASQELCRVLSPGGRLYMVLPVAGTDRVFFNAHRVYTFEHVQKLFQGLLLKSTALLCDQPGPFLLNAGKEVFDRQSYGCGCFEFLKPM